MTNNDPVLYSLWYLKKYIEMYFFNPYLMVVARVELAVGGLTVTGDTLQRHLLGVTSSVLSLRYGVTEHLEW